MLDFTSALYLGLRHPSATLKPWPALSSGRPAALAEALGADAVATEFARLAGCEAGLLLPSTLHLFFDLFATLPPRSTYFVDSGSYPVARWGVERSTVRGAGLREFRHYDAEALEQMLAREARIGFRPVVVVDGYCPGCGVPAPVNDLLTALRRYDGLLVIDDTQAFGILGERRRTDAASIHSTEYGSGGGGILRHAGASGQDVLLAASLAKGFGAPVALLAGSASRMARFSRSSLTRMHCSPPSVAAVRAAERAFEVNARRGDALRRRLAQLVKRFRDHVTDTCAIAHGGIFPMLTLGCESARGANAISLHRQLAQTGIRSVLHGGREPRTSFLFTAAHDESAVDSAADALNLCLSAGRRRRSGGLS
jgi:8-amino-7-oxononanoate synthase